VRSSAGIGSAGALGAIWDMDPPETLIDAGERRGR
jgi:hypothetical protein